MWAWPQTVPSHTGPFWSGFKVISASDTELGRLSVRVPAVKRTHWQQQVYLHFYLQCCRGKCAWGQCRHRLQDDGTFSWPPSQWTRDQCNDVSHLLSSTSGWAPRWPNTTGSPKPWPPSGACAGQHHRLTTPQGWVMSQQPWGGGPAFVLQKWWMFAFLSMSFRGWERVILWSASRRCLYPAPSMAGSRHSRYFCPIKWPQTWINRDWTIAPQGNAGLLPMSVWSHFVNPSVGNLLVCDRYGCIWHVANVLMLTHGQQPWNSCLNKATPIPVFALEDRAQASCLRTRQHFSTVLGGWFKKQNCQQNVQTF